MLSKRRPTDDAYERQAEEVAHAVTAGRSTGSILTAGSGVQRQEAPSDPRDPPGSPPVKPVTWTGSPKCGPNFCRPFATRALAEQNRLDLWVGVLSIRTGIAAAVSSKVLPLWDAWAWGGDSSIRDLTSGFGVDFTMSPTTSKTTTFLMSELTKTLTTSPPAIPSSGALTLDLATVIPAAVKAIDTPGGPHEMNFNYPKDIPGNLVGGIGKDEAANPIGAAPSPQDDARLVKGTVTLVQMGTGDVQVIPNMTYTVKDTVDLCPGDCGTGKEQFATLPMSYWEATGISGDVPFTVDFPALTVPFTIKKP